MKVPELLVPVGTIDKLETALLYGADAVYMSGKQFGLRALAGNFSIDELHQAATMVKRAKKKMFVTVNAFCRSADIEQLREYLDALQSIPIDALIISDPGVIRLARQHCPDIPVHLSTQANTMNSESVLFWQEQGIQRVVLARELSAGEVQHIIEHTDCEIEVFIHGALCIAFAGKCYLSAYLDGRESNSGICSQPCRWQYDLVERSGGRHIPLESDGDNLYLFSSKDLCLLPCLTRIARMGVDSVKIEGRMKSEYYIGVVTRVYREALDLLKNDGDLSEELLIELVNELKTVSHREYTTGFFGEESGEGRVHIAGKYIQSHLFVGIIQNPDGKSAVISPRNKIILNDSYQMIGSRRSEDCTVKVMSIMRDGVSCSELNPNQTATIEFDSQLVHGNMLRKKREEN